MKNKFIPLKVKEVKKTTSDCSVITLDVPEENRVEFEFTQGQYLTFRSVINGEDIRRSYSLCSSPLDHEWKVAVKKIEDGRFSSFANDVLKKGDTLEVMAPQGKFHVDIDPSKARNYVAFAAGSGITPILSIIKTHLELEPESTFELFYVNRTVASIILKEEIEALKNKYLNRFQFSYFLTRQERNIPLFNGRLDQDKMSVICSKLIELDLISDFFICGPNEMIFFIRDYLINKGVAEKKIHFELFNTEALPPRKKTVKKKILNGETSQIVIQEGGKTLRFSIPKASNNILDVALQNNADLPFACKGGVCCTCRAKLLEGKVEMEHTYGLEQDELDAGYILTCQAVPLTEKVVVDFDQ